jgi:hypothetical protein
MGIDVAYILIDWGQNRCSLQQVSNFHLSQDDRQHGEPNCTTQLQSQATIKAHNTGEHGMA